MKTYIADRSDMNKTFNKLCTHADTFIQRHYPHRLYRISDTLDWKMWEFSCWIHKHGISSRVCSDCCCIRNKHDDNHDDVNAIESEWHDSFDDVCWLLGFDKRSADALWDNIGVGNNWEHLHMTDAEREYDADKWFDEFSSDLFYCSDRWSFDRLLRVQWKFRQWLAAVDGC